jgi:hypothetical protein
MSYSCAGDSGDQTTHFLPNRAKRPVVNHTVSKHTPFNPTNRIGTEVRSCGSVSYNADIKQRDPIGWVVTQEVGMWSKMAPQRERIVID